MRKRVKLQIQRSKEYLDLRYWWLHELRQLRAKLKYGSGSKASIKAAQRVLAKLRKDG